MHRAKRLLGTVFFVKAMAMGLCLSTTGFLQTAKAATTLNGAEMFSRETVKYGRWEIRMRIAATPGSVSSFFTYYDNSYVGQPEPWLEIDIEALGNKGKGFQSNLITGNAANKVTSEKFHTNAEDLSQGFHTYELDWTPDSIVYRLDGVLLRKNLGTDPQVNALTGKAMTYRMNLWASTATSWVGTLDPSKLPVVQTVNWIAYSAYTPGQGPGGSNFTPKWEDDFNNLNTQRWSRADWTFDQNMADFQSSNAVVSGGYLMLILSNKGWTGTVTPPNDPKGNTRTTPTILRVKRGQLQKVQRDDRWISATGIPGAFDYSGQALFINGRQLKSGF